MCAGHNDIPWEAHRSCSGHIPYTCRHSLSIHSVFTHYLLTINTLSAHYLVTIHSLSNHNPLSIRVLYSPSVWLVLIYSLLACHYLLSIHSGSTYYTSRHRPQALQPIVSEQCEWIVSAWMGGSEPAPVGPHHFRYSGSQTLVRNLDRANSNNSLQYMMYKKVRSASKIVTRRAEKNCFQNTSQKKVQSGFQKS